MLVNIFKANSSQDFSSWISGVSLCEFSDKSWKVLIALNFSCKLFYNDKADFVIHNKAGLLLS